MQQELPNKTAAALDPEQQFICHIGTSCTAMLLYDLLTGWQLHAGHWLGGRSL